MSVPVFIVLGQGGGTGGEGLHVHEEKRDEKRNGGELIHLSALCFVIVIFYIFGFKINLN